MEVIKEHEFSCSGHCFLKIDVSDGRLTLHGGNNSRIKLADAGSIPLKVNRLGSTISVGGTACDLDIWLPADSDILIDGRRLNVTMLSGAGSAVIDVTDGDVLVSDWQGDLEIDTSKGDVNLRAVAGQVLVDTAGGDVDLTGSSGSFALDTASGSVTVSDVSASLHIDTGSGTVALKHCQGAVTISGGTGLVTIGDVFSKNLRTDTISGQINVTLPGGNPGRWQLRTGRGDINLTVPENTSSRFELHAPVLDIDELLPLSSCKQNKNSARGCLGEGVGWFSAGSSKGRIVLSHSSARETIDLEPIRENADEETLKILNMLQQGTISAQEAVELIDALDGGEDSA